MDDWQKAEWLKCSENLLYFVDSYCYIYDATAREWIPFRLWRAQARTLRTLFNNLLVIILKARQLGLTWLVLAFALWLMLFHPAATVLLFSRRDDEAVHLLERLKGIYQRLPDWMKARAIGKDNEHIWELSNGSIARAFPTSAGDSYTATLAIVDEADLVTDLNRLMRAVKPTIDGGGRMILLSRSEKKKPASTFKRIYRSARQRLTSWKAVFLPWNARPDRGVAWYAAQKADIEERTGALDDLYEQYPTTEDEALAPSTRDKRIPLPWLKQCYEARAPIFTYRTGRLAADWLAGSVEPAYEDSGDYPAVPGLEIHELPRTGVRYVLGADTAEGNPTSDESSATMLEADSGWEVAAFHGRYQPSTFGSYLVELARYYNGARVLVERNNHGHAVILWILANAPDVVLLEWTDGRPGWVTTAKSKVLLYDQAIDFFRFRQTRIRSLDTYLQLSAIEASTLRAPPGEADDRAVGYVLGLAAMLAPREERPREPGVQVRVGY
ncbi:MAG: hypothetical protein DRJ03_08850 [Chloroflexi bacterium]|nr:MAG: hypothetical protein DRI81_00645 [Chloroflexota bacterium]RLC86416.1 MAG: hypothetical protein DRJ03_08850 [Chloroflexota bacterium]